MLTAHGHLPHISAPLTERVGRSCEFQIRAGIVDEEERDLSGQWTDAVIVREFDRDWVIIQLVDYDSDRWWDGYVTVKTTSDRFRWI